MDAYPIYTVRGDWSSGFRITAENRVIEYPYSVVATAPVTIDCARGRLLIGGVDRTSELVSREWHKNPAACRVRAGCAGARAGNRLGRCNRTLNIHLGENI